MFYSIFPPHFYFYLKFSFFRTPSLSPLGVTKEPHRDFYGIRKKSHLCRLHIVLFTQEELQSYLRQRLIPCMRVTKPESHPWAPLGLNKSENTKGYPTHPRAHPQHWEPTQVINLTVSCKFFSLSVHKSVKIFLLFVLISEIVPA